MSEPKLIYLAVPYTHPNSEVVELRFKAVNKMAAKLMKAGAFIFSPISHTHPIAKEGLPKGWDYWESYDKLMISKCDMMMVLKLPGWEDSVGVAEEILIAKSLPILIQYIEYKPDETFDKLVELDKTEKDSEAKTSVCSFDNSGTCVFATNKYPECISFLR